MKDIPVVSEAHIESEVTAAATGAPASATAPAAGAAATATPAAPTKTITKFVEIGTGELHVNTVDDPSTKKTRGRLVLREDRTKRNVLNAPIFVSMVYKLETDKFVKFHSLDLDGKMATFLLKFKEKSQAQEVMNTIEFCLDMIKSGQP